MGAYKQINEIFQKEYKERGAILKSKLVDWRATSPIIRVDKPTNLARARELGYKAKQGVIVARVRVNKGLSLCPAMFSS